MTPVDLRSHTEAYLREIAHQRQTTERMRVAARAELGRRAAAVAKAATMPLAVFDRNGKLLGIVDPADLTPVTEAQ